MAKCSSSDSGALTLEFALLAPAFILLMYSLFEIIYVTCLPLLMNLTLESTARFDSLHKTSATERRQTLLDDSQRILFTLQRALGLILAPDKLSCRLFSYPTFQTFRHHSQNTLPDSAQAGEISFYEVKYLYTVTSPFTQCFLGQEWPLTVTTAVRYER